LFPLDKAADVKDEEPRRQVQEEWECLPDPPQDYITDVDSPITENPNDREGDATTQDYVSPLFINNPSNFQTSYELTDDLSGYNIYEQIGEIDFRNPSFISFDDYLEYRQKNQMSSYFKDQGLAVNQANKKGLVYSFDLGKVSDIFGGGAVEIRPNGSATLDFSIDHNVNENPNLPIRQQKTTTFNFDQAIQLSVTGQIGEKLKLSANWDTKATFDFDNTLLQKYEGSEDQIIQEIEAGNVSMPLGNSLVQGRQNLFGLKTKLKFGPVLITSVASLERGKTESVTAKGGGAVETQYSKKVNEYDEYRHFFLSHDFRSRYENALLNLPVINSPFRITRVEVWVTNDNLNSTRNTRNALGFVDLGENDTNGSGVVFNDALTMNSTGVADNGSNNLYNYLIGNTDFREKTTAVSSLISGSLPLTNAVDFELVENMKLLDPNAFSFHPQLGYVSLNSPVRSDQVLFVAYEYTLNGQIFQVGEFSQDIPSNALNSNVLFLKELKPSVVRPEYDNAPFPTWDLMMKNIYSIGGYGLQSDGFFLDIKYESGTSAGKINFFPDGALQNRPLLQVMRLDLLTNNTSLGPDNYFDFIEGLTIVADKGLIIFPLLEPFGSHLSEQMSSANDSAKYVFQPLYDKTRQDAIQQFPELDRYTLEGWYRSASSSEIPLNTFNLAEGSVRVTANGIPLIENQQYTVDYFGGKVTITDPSILSSGQDIQVQYESASLYNVQSKTFLGTRAEFIGSDKFQAGFTAVHSSERPFTIKTNLGDEPYSNTLLGLDASVNTESEFLTKMVDKIPLITTKETSNIRGAVETAVFIPGQPSLVRNQTDQGIVYLDDFEAAKMPFSIQGVNRWKLSPFPVTGNNGNPDLFDPTNSVDPLSSGYTRAKLAWYQIDQSFYQTLTSQIPRSDLENHYSRQVTPFELFPSASRPFGATTQAVFDMHYIPAERGPYNFQADPNEINIDGTFTNPEQNWAGIMTETSLNTDFEATNIEFIEFWLMDPFAYDTTGVPHEGGKFYLNLGRITEDILPDNYRNFENGLPTDTTTVTVDETDWGRVPVTNPPTNAFSNDPDARVLQDVGLDGLSDTAELRFFQDYIDRLELVVGGSGSPAYDAAFADPSSDNFEHFRDEDIYPEGTSLLDRYLRFNGLEGNSPIGDNNVNYVQQATQEPDTEDLNRNGTLNTSNEYWEYELEISPDALRRGNGFVVDEVTTQVPDAGNITWYQFRIPLTAGRAVNNIPNFKTIDFIRFYMTDFKEEVILRMTELQLVATQWRRFQESLQAIQDTIITDPGLFPDFEIGSVSLEENSSKLPFNYMIPPEIQREAFNGNTQPGFLQDERSLLLKTCNLGDGDARGVFKVVNHDMRNYKRIKMWVHAEAIEDAGVPSNVYEEGDVTCFMRLGLDNSLNYYEYELPLNPSSVNLGAANLENVWANQFDFDLTVLGLAKADRNLNGTGVNIRYEYTSTDTALLPAGHKVYVKGTPKLSDIKTIMIGIRNPKDPMGQPICVEVWVNELRLTDFDDKVSWAANANLNVQLADFANISASVSQRSDGFGALDQKISERSQEDVFQYDVAGNFQLGKFFPKKWGIQLPMYATIGERIINPIYDPQEADVRTEALIENLNPDDRQRELERIQDYQKTRSISFNNVKKNKTNMQKKPMFWDISNFDFTYAYNEQISRNSTIEKRFVNQHRGVINYRYNFTPVNIQPFKNWKKKNPISTFNFSPLPSSIAVSLIGDRQFEETRYRSTTLFGGEVQPNYTKNFMIRRNYNLTWALTQGLNLTFNASNASRVDEVRGYWDQATQEERDSIGTLGDNLLFLGRDTARGHDQLVNMGRTIGYNHNVDVNYQLPFSKWPWTDWLNGNVRYTGTFDWQQAPETNRALGSTVSNTQRIDGNARVNLRGLYEKIKPIKRILKGEKKPKKPKTRQEIRREKKLKRRDKKDEKRKKKGKEPKKWKELKELEPKKKDDDKEDKFVFFRKLGSELVRIVLSVQSVDVNYSQNSGTVLPGYLPGTDNFGFDFGYTDEFENLKSKVLPPTWGFLVGSQRDIRQIAGENRWITRDTTLSNFFAQNKATQFTGRTSVELFKGFRVDINMSRNYSENFSELYRWVPDSSSYVSSGGILNGNFNMSYIFIGSAFKNQDDVFADFESVRRIISQRLYDANPNRAVIANPNSAGVYRNGYTGTSQDVLIPSLLASYGVFSPEKITLDKLPMIPLPNWSVNYSGLTKIPFFKKHFNTFTLKHTYRATYTVGSFINNVDAVDTDGDGFAENFVGVGVNTTTGDSLYNFQPGLNIASVQISEQFSPFIGVNFNMKNGVNGSVDYKKGRQLTLSVGALQLTESRNEDLSIMLGYRKDKLNMRLNLFGKELNLENSANFQLRVSMRDTRERNLDLDSELPAEYTRGNRNISIQPAIDYVVSSRLNIRIFFERTVNIPYTSNSYRTAFSSGGFQVRFTLAN